MTKEETISNIKTYLNGDMAIGNIISLRSVLESAMKYLCRPSLPSNLNETAEAYAKNRAKDPELCYEYLYYEIQEAVKFGAEWMVGQGVTVEGNVEGNWRNQEVAPYEIYVTSDCLPKDTEFKFGDKVIVQIRKEQ